MDSNTVSYILYILLDTDFAYAFYTIIALAIWHFIFQIPREFILIEGSLESYGSIGKKSTARGAKFGNLIVKLEQEQKINKVTFLKTDGTRVAFKSITLKRGLWEQLRQYTPTSLTGRFCLMKQYGRFFLFAHADNDTQIALSKDLYFPKSFSNKLFFGTIQIFFKIAALYLGIGSIMVLFFSISKPSIIAYPLIDLSFPITFLYFVYFNFISSYPRKIYAKQKELLEQARIPAPII